MLLLLGLNTYSCIADCKANPNSLKFLRLKSNLYHYFALFGELDCVIDKVDNNLPQPGGISNQGIWDVGPNVLLQLQTFFLRTER